MEEPKTTKLRKWHFLLLGSLLVLLSAFLWYWNWWAIGLPIPLQPEHFVTLASYVVGIFVLCVFIYRLRKSQVEVMLVWLIVVNVIAALVTVWVNRSYPAAFEVMTPFETSNDPDYVADWLCCFLKPALWAIHSGLLLLWAESLVMYLIRKPGYEPG